MILLVHQFIEFIRLALIILFISYIIESLRKIEFCLPNHLEQFGYQKFEVYGWNEKSVLDKNKERFAPTCAIILVKYKIR